VSPVYIILSIMKSQFLQKVKSLVEVLIECLLGYPSRIVPFSERRKIGIGDYLFGYVYGHPIFIGIVCRRSQTDDVTDFPHCVRSRFKIMWTTD
jgi:hypothetical protein